MRRILFLLLVVGWSFSAVAEEVKVPDSLLTQGERLRLGVQAYDAEDWEQAAKWLMPLAISGEVEAQWRIAWMYESGYHFVQNSCLSTLWHDKAARQGHPRSAALLGSAYGAGFGVSANPEKEFRWLLWAARQGNKWADKQARLAGKYLDPDLRARIAEEIAGGWDAKSQPPAELYVFAEQKPDPTLTGYYIRHSGMGNVIDCSPIAVD